MTTEDTPLIRVRRAAEIRLESCHAVATHMACSRTDYSEELAAEIRIATVSSRLDDVLAVLDLVPANPEAIKQAVDFVRAHARRNPVFAKGYEKDVIAQVRQIIEALDGNPAQES